MDEIPKSPKTTPLSAGPATRADLLPVLASLARPAAAVAQDAGPEARIVSCQTPFDTALEEHHGIRRDIQTLTDRLGEYRPGMGARAWYRWIETFSAELAQLHGRLVEHFAEEEQSGLYETLGEKLPNLVSRMRFVREEHTWIAEELASILSALDALRPTLPLEPRLLDRAREVFYRVVCHERKESDLIARAYLEDLGARD